MFTLGSYVWCSMNLEFSHSVLPRDLTIKMTTEADLEKVININFESTGNIDGSSDLEKVIDLELKVNNSSDRVTNIHNA